MKIRTQTIKLATAAVFFFAGANSAAALEISPQLKAAALQIIPQENTAITHCGCDTKEGIEMYVQNLIADAKKRGLDCQSSYHIPACITTYCSICKGHGNLVENCIQTGVEYFTKNSSFCSQKQSGVASYMPDMQFILN